MRRSFVMLCALLVLPATSGGAAADWQEGPWTTTVDHRSHATSWTTVNDATNDTITGRIEADEGWVLLESGDTDAGFTISSIVEFQDHDQDGRFSLGDPVVQQFRMADLRMAGSTYRREADGDHLAVEYWGFSGLRLTVDFTWGHDEGGARPDTVLAMQAHVAGFPFKSDNQTRLALQMRLHQAFARDGDAATVRVGELMGVATWQNRTATGVPIGVTFQVYGAGGGETLLVFSHPRGELVQGFSMGFAKAPEQALLPSFWDDVSLADWRLWMVGVLAFGVVSLVLVARRIMWEK